MRNKSSNKENILRIQKMLTNILNLCHIFQDLTRISSKASFQTFRSGIKNLINEIRLLRRAGCESEMIPRINLSKWRE